LEKGRRKRDDEFREQKSIFLVPFLALLHGPVRPVALMIKA
jgi:hypothetical protein